MGDRRMFSKRITDSAKFLRMPISSQALYFHLGLHADDDGVVEAFPILKLSGCTEDDLRVLVAKGFIQVLNEDLVAYITDWNENNLIRDDRINYSIYRDLLVSVNPAVQLIEKRPRADLKKQDGQAMDSPRTGKGQPKISKDKISKDKRSKEKIFTPPTLEEVADYVRENDLHVNPQDFFDYFSEGNWMDSRGNKVKSWKQKIRTWENFGIKDKKGVQAAKSMNNYSSQGEEVDYDALAQASMERLYKEYG